jgi:hypothetical protein
VAAVASGIGGRQRVVTVHMTLRASGYLARGRHLVRSRESPTGGAVIELAVRPNGDGMATGTSRGRRREIRRDVIRHITS